MANFSIQTSFAAGEIAPALYGQVHNAKYSVAASTCRNFIISFRGGAYSRAGTALCNRCKQPWGGAAPRLLRFQFNNNQGYALEFGDNYMRVFANGAPVVEAAVSITGITNANPAVVSALNAIGDGDWVVIEGAEGMTELNGGTYIVENAAPGSFTLTDLNGAPINTTTYGAYTSGGTVSRIFTLITPWLAADLPYLKIAQSADVMTMTCVNQVTDTEYTPQDLARITASEWVLTETTFGATIAPPATCVATATTQPSQATSPPTLPAAYAYVTTAVSSATGEESIASPVANATNSVDIASTAGSIIIDWSAVRGAGTYNIYKAPTSYNTQPGNTANALPVPAGAIFGYCGTSYGTEFVDSNITPDDAEVPPTHTDPFAPGQILFVDVLSGGTGLTTVDYTINSATGSGAILTPVIVNGAMTAMIVANGGENYQSGDTITFGGPGAVATGNITFGPNPTNGETITLNGQVWTFVTSSPGANETQIEGSLSATLTSLANGVSQSTDPDLVVANYLSNSTQLIIAYATPGVAGNAYTLAASAATPSAGTLTGGGTGTAPEAVLVIGPETGTYPGCCAYFQQRRVYAASLNDPDTFWMSHAGNFLNFDTSIPVTDNDSITGTPWAQQVNGIQFMIPMPGGLVVLTGLGAWQVGGAGSAATNPQPITPSSIQAIQQAFNGCSDIVVPLTINFDILYVQSKGSVVRDLSWNYWINIYTGSDLTQLSGQLFTGYQMLQSCWCEEPFKIAWFARDDGAMLSLTYLKEQEVYGWARHDTLGEIVSVASVTEPPVDALYLIAARPTLNASFGQAYYVERMNNRIWNSVEDVWAIDCGLAYPMPTPDAILTAGQATGNTFFATSVPIFTPESVGQIIRMGGGIATITGYGYPQFVYATWNLPPVDLVPDDPSGAVSPQMSGNWSMTQPITVIEGLTHLTGMTVTGLADGIPIPPQIVSTAGTITLSSPASNIKVGLPFLPQLQLPRLDVQGGVTVQGRRKTVTAVTARVEASVGGVTGTNQPDGAAQYPPGLAVVWGGMEDISNYGATYSTYTAPGGGTVTAMFTGDLRTPVTASWAKPGQIAFQQDLPLPLQIIDVVPEWLDGDVPELGYAPQQQSGGKDEKRVARGPGLWMLQE